MLKADRTANTIAGKFLYNMLIGLLLGQNITPACYREKCDDRGGEQAMGNSESHPFIHNSPFTPESYYDLADFVKKFRDFSSRNDGIQCRKLPHLAVRDVMQYLIFFNDRISKDPGVRFYLV